MYQFSNCTDMNNILNIQTELSKLESDIEKSAEQLKIKLTNKLRKLYKGKKAFMTLIDGWTDGEEVPVETIILDIFVNGHRLDKLWISITYNPQDLKYKSEPKPDSIVSRTLPLDFMYPFIILKPNETYNTVTKRINKIKEI